MPKETSLNDPLAGAEIKNIILSKVSDALDRDLTLGDDIAYAGFIVKFEAKIGFVRSTTFPTMVWGVEAKGETPTAVETITVEYQTDSPNRAREENNLPIPVMVQTPSGPRREKVRFQKPAAYKAKKNA